MKKTIAIIVSLLFVLSIAGLSFAAEKAAAPAAAPAKAAPAEKKAEPAKMEEKKAPAKIKQVTGEVKSVDAKAITVKGKKADVTVNVDDKTKIMAGKEKKALADVKAGDKVSVKYTEAEGKNMAKSIAIKPAAMMEEKKMEKKAAPAKAAPAEKK